MKLKYIILVYYYVLVIDVPLSSENHQLRLHFAFIKEMLSKCDRFI